MNRVIALKLVGGLSDTEKMPGKSFGISASQCKTGSKLAQIPGTVCSMCYAKKGHYALFHHVINPAHERRLAAIGHPEWIDAMVKALEKESWFRWFDSGDIQSTQMLLDIFEVCRRTPNTKHWLATRERRFLSTALTKSAAPDNLCIRVSATWPDKPVKGIPGLQEANVHKDWSPVGHECPAPKQHGRCDTCRACWDKSIQTVSYKQH